MTRLKSVHQPPVAPSLPAELPTEPGIWKKLLPDGREVPWIILSPAEPDPAFGEAPSRSARGCYKCTN